MRYKFKHKPYDHQRIALVKSWNKPDFALFMDMGTGKSKVLIDNCGILYDRGEIEAALIIAPKGVYRNWERSEIPKHLPDHIERKVVAWSPEKTKKKQTELDTLFLQDEELKILLMNVEAFSTKRGVEFAEKFLMSWTTLLAVDESTTIKNHKAKRTKSLIKLGNLATYKRVLTGSPVTRSPMDLFSQCFFLNEEILQQNSFWAYQNRYAKMIRSNSGTHSFNQIVGFQNLDEISRLIEPYSYRVKKEECLDLPDKVYQRRTVELTNEQKVIYNQLVTMALAILAEEGGTISTTTVLTQILRLQQGVSGHCKMDDGRIIDVPSNKMPELLQIVGEINGKAIIWANFTDDIEKIHKKLSEIYGLESCATFYGGTKAENRQDIVEAFQDPLNPLRFFIGQPRTGGYGLTLTEAKTVIYYSNGYDLEIRLQSEDRAHRIGQTNKVTYIDIIAENTVDDKILKALRAKIDIASIVLAEGYTTWLI